jgi:hypothetical protein
MPDPRASAEEGAEAVQLKPGVVDWPAVQARLREQGIVLVGGSRMRRRRSTSASRMSSRRTGARFA